MNADLDPTLLALFVFVLALWWFPKRIGHDLPWELSLAMTIAVIAAGVHLHRRASRRR